MLTPACTRNPPYTHAYVHTHASVQNHTPSYQGSYTRLRSHSHTRFTRSRQRAQILLVFSHLRVDILKQLYVQTAIRQRVHTCSHTFVCTDL